MSAQDKKKAKVQLQGKSSQVMSSSSTNKSDGSNQTIAECMKNRVVVWHGDSKEHKERITAVLNMFITTGMFCNLYFFIIAYYRHNFILSKLVTGLS